MAFTVLTGAAYPLLIHGVAQATFNGKANGSLVQDADGNVVGSTSIGQPFTAKRYFHPRPSAATYVPGAQGGGVYAYGSNLGPTNPELEAAVKAATSLYRTENGLAATARIPVDAVTASGSGLDPHISVANARIQARRVAAARGMPEAAVLGLVAKHTDGRGLGFLGEPGVNVLALNLALDRLMS